MERFLVESSHSAEECHHVVEQFIFHGHIRNFDWGCLAGVHTGWAIIEAENEEQASLIVPPRLRAQARAVRLSKFTPESMQAEHS